MTTILDKIMADKKKHIALSKEKLSLGTLEKMIDNQPPSRSFQDSIINNITRKRTALIAEIKKKSPSAGVIRSDFCPASIARSYEKAGATCLSVLTDNPYFGGEDHNIMLAKNACQLPILRKDFIIDPYQITEAKAIGADAILLIMAILDDTQAKKLMEKAFDYDLDVLIEIHDADECQRALKLNPPLLGINNRNLKTFETHLNVCVDLSKQCPKETVIIAESGIHTHHDILNLHKHNIYAFLVGEGLMKQPNIEQATHNLIHG